MSSGTLTVTTSGLLNNSVEKYSLAWTSTSGGAVSQTFTLGAGTVVLVYSTPGSPAPTASYTITVLDANSVSILTDGAGGYVAGTAAGSATAGAAGVPLYPDGAADGKAYAPLFIPGGTYTLTVGSAGNAKQGTLDIYVRPGVV